MRIISRALAIFNVAVVVVWVIYFIPLEYYKTDVFVEMVNQNRIVDAFDFISNVNRNSGGYLAWSILSILPNSIFLLVLKRKMQAKRILWPLFLFNIYGIYSGVMFLPNWSISERHLNLLLKSPNMEEIIDQISTSNFFIIYSLVLLSPLLIDSIYLWSMSEKRQKPA
ncbi:MAG: hypothetical protein LBL72_11255 [Candidatus Accumulibacter sp.]|jgi:hypothetical protein|nr:hypothetical protein [Accumulibacter sp.]